MVSNIFMFLYNIMSCISNILTQDWFNSIICFYIIIHLALSVKSCESIKKYITTLFIGEFSGKDKKLYNILLILVVIEGSYLFYIATTYTSLLNICACVIMMYVLRMLHSYSYSLINKYSCRLSAIGGSVIIVSDILFIASSAIMIIYTVYIVFSSFGYMNVFNYVSAMFR